MQNIILIGFMGCGKTSLGGKLARVFHYQFLDTDQLIEKELGCTIREYFEREGEEAFREQETMLLKKLLPTLKHTVLATGGGLPLRKENAKLLRQMGRVFFLKASRETTIARLQGDSTRPLIAGEGLEEKVDRLLAERLPLYTEAADEIIETDGKSFYEMIKEVERRRNGGKE